MSLRMVPPKRVSRNPDTTHITSPPTRSLLLKSALRYAAKGKPVFPVVPGGKKPLIKDWPNAASTDPRRIHMWWSRWPGANIGTPTGERSGFWVLDVDRPEALEELEAQIGPLPPTPTVRTPRGGRHLYFRHVEGITNSPGSLPTGIDVRGEGGYVLVPPSAGYTWEDRSPVAEAPKRLLDLVRQKAEKKRALRSERRVRGAAGAPIKEGDRNRTLFFEALDLKDAGKSPEAVLAEIEARNEARCVSPLDAGEVEGIAKSACRYPVRSGSPSPEMLEAAEELERRWWTHSWRGMGGKTDRDVYRVLIELARRYGRLLDDGSVTVSASVRSVALAAATRYETVSGRATKRLASAGLIRKTDGGRGATEAATWVLMGGARLPVNTQQWAAELPCVYDPSRPRLWDLETPAFRWTGLVKKGRAGVLYVLEAHGPMQLDTLADLMGWSRPRDLRRRYVDPLVDLGLVEERDGVYGLRGDHAERIEEVRRSPYTTVSRRRRTTRDGDRTVRWVDESENTASEIKREEKDLKDHEKQRESYRLHLASKTDDEGFRELLNRWDDEAHEVIDPETGEIVSERLAGTAS